MRTTQGTPTDPPATGRPHRRLDVNRIKAVIVFTVGSLTAFGSALTGLGSQVAFAPMLTWMLGFGPEKARATATRHAAYTALAAVIGIYAARSAPTLFLLRGFLLMVGATVGAILAARLTPKADQVSRRQIFHTLAIGLTLFVLIQTARASWLDFPHYAVWSTPLALAGIGLVVGALAQAMGLVGGVLLVPALYYLGGFPAREAVPLSLLVVALASILPAWSYSRQGISDTAYGAPSVIGALLGGFAGGLLLTHLPEKAVLILFAVAAMFLSGRELARLSLENSSPTPR